MLLEGWEKTQRIIGNGYEILYLISLQEMSLQENVRERAVGAFR